ncbi:MAG: pitrilysin family protein [Patescibacteria group bacterium]
MYKISKLKNGLTLLKVPLKGTQSVTVLVLFPVGSRYETKDYAGAAHFVEHMIFKGTEKRPLATDISRTLDALGADYNAFTSKDYTGYYIKIAQEKQEVAFDILSDVIYHSTFAAAEIEKEKGAIVEELRMYKDNPGMAIDMLFDKLMFGDTPLGWDIGGSESTVRSFTRDQLSSYYQAHYSPKNTLLVVAGAFGASAEKKIASYFGESPAKGGSASGGKNILDHKKSFAHFEWPKKDLPLAERIMAEEKKLDQANLIIGFPGLENDHPDRYAASILLNILGGGMSSRLFVEVREKRGLAYMVRAGSTSFRDVGVASVQAGLDPSRLSEALQVIKAEIERIAKEPVTAQELENAKTNLAGRLALSLEDSSTQAEWYGKQFLFNKKIRLPKGVVGNINKVTIKDVQRLAKQFFIMSEMRLAIIGPLSKAVVIDMVSKL